MQRQSLGSPSSKLVKNEQQQQRFITTSETHNQLPSSSISTINGLLLYGDDQCKQKQDELKKKLLRFILIIHEFAEISLLSIINQLAIQLCSNVLSCCNAMDRGKRPSKPFAVRSNKMFMDLKDIIRENALPFLPAKLLFKFRSVCRDWKLQISAPFFAHNQSLSHRVVLSFILQTPGKPPSIISVDPTSCGVPDPLMSFLPEQVDIRSSSNGLLCCQGQSGDKPYYICNPVTREWKKLPKPIADHGYPSAIVLIFEPSLLNFEADYKLVCAFPSNDFDDATEFEIYSSKENSWRISGEICFANVKIDPSSGVYANGVVYWRGRSLLAFDLTKDRSQTFNQFYSNGILGTVDGKLCKANFHGHTITVDVLDNAHYNTMQMSSTSRMWKQREKITVNKDVLGVELFDPALIGVSGNFLVFKIGEKNFYYDFQTKELKSMSPISYRKNMICLPYVNSLASL
ncbi:hypothetical protein BUALT_Bualt04G0074500 [Buddleja alternifolia]|uniref:F-box associated beta-propeller type 1 domain-containing protein n=1 Tax=Buddleja alternifolia TaxID=168488 RepID=A0AAV6XNF0_9LAMI|nr:hypothetical protein BUALT_Bualt04G0074500 [Buddleja alternifolia]